MRCVILIFNFARRQRFLQTIKFRTSIYSIAYSFLSTQLLLLFKAALKVFSSSCCDLTTTLQKLEKSELAPLPRFLAILFKSKRFQFNYLKDQASQMYFRFYLCRYKKFRL